MIHDLFCNVIIVIKIVFYSDGKGKQQQQFYANNHFRQKSLLNQVKFWLPEKNKSQKNIDIYLTMGYNGISKIVK